MTWELVFQLLVLGFGGLLILILALVIVTLIGIRLNRWIDGK